MDDGKDGLLNDSTVNNTTFPITRKKISFLSYNNIYKVSLWRAAQLYG